MALLYQDNAVFYHPWDTYTEFLRGGSFSATVGSTVGLAPSPLFVSGLFGSGTAGKCHSNTVSYLYPCPATSSVTLTTAFWMSGVAANNVEVRVGWGRTSMADARNTLGIRTTTSGVRIVGEAANAGLNWSAINFGALPNVSFFVVRLVPGGGVINAYVSVNGSPWQSAGAVSSAGFTVGSGSASDNPYIGAYFNATGTIPVLDETVLWMDAPQFTDTELSNLYQLANSRSATMDQYSTVFSAPVPTTVSGLCGLGVKGSAVASGMTPGFVHGRSSGSRTCDLSVKGIVPGVTVSGSCDLSVTGIPGSLNGTMPFYTQGCDLVSGSAPFSITGLAILMPCSGMIPAMMGGFAPKPSPSCPTLDPLASIQIGEDLIEIYQARIDALINQLGKNVLLEYDPIITPCPNCYFDPEAKRSNGIYKPGGPTPFARGQKCPHCKGTGTVEEKVTKCIKCLLKWNPSDYASYGVSIVDPKAIVRTKGYLTDAVAIERASTAIVNYDIQAIMRLRVRRLRGPIPVGLRADRYCITFWELIDA